MRKPCVGGKAWEGGRESEREGGSGGRPSIQKDWRERDDGEVQERGVDRRGRDYGIMCYSRASETTLSVSPLALLLLLHFFVTSFHLQLLRRQQLDGNFTNHESAVRFSLRPGRVTVPSDELQQLKNRHAARWSLHCHFTFLLPGKMMCVSFTGMPRRSARSTLPASKVPIMVSFSFLYVLLRLTGYDVLG